jgi:hypothetical protein
VRDAKCVGPESRSLISSLDKNFFILNEPEHAKDAYRGKQIDEFASICLRDYAQDFITCCEFPYWRRLRILQELILAKCKYIIFGGSIQLWDDFMWLSEPLSLRLSVSESHHGSIDNSFEDGSMYALQELACGASEKGPNPRLISAVKQCATRQCSDPRDRWYGCLGIVGRVGEVTAFPVDYSIDSAELLSKVYEYIEREADLRHADIHEVIETLSPAMRVAILYLCRDCAKTHSSVDKSSIPIASDTNFDEEPYLFVTVAERSMDEIKAWYGSHKQLRIRCNLCILCDQLLTLKKWLKHSEGTIRGAPQQLWSCLVKKE